MIRQGGASLSLFSENLFFVLALSHPPLPLLPRAVPLSRGRHCSVVLVDSGLHLLLASVTLLLDHRGQVHLLAMAAMVDRRCHLVPR